MLNNPLQEIILTEWRYRIKIKNQSNKMEYLYNMGSYKNNYYKGGT